MATTFYNVRLSFTYNLSFLLLKVLKIEHVFRPELEKMYFFSRLAVELNEPEEGVAPTDSRNRPDQRLMEHGTEGTSL